MRPSPAEEPSQTQGGATTAPGEDLIWRNKVGTMKYARLGRTNYMVSRIVQGFAGDEGLWRRLLAKGVNYWDSGDEYARGNHERALKPFLKRYRDKLWITSKATDLGHLDSYSGFESELRRIYLQAMKAYLPEQDYARLNQRFKDGSKDNQDHQELLRFHEAAVAREKATGEKPDLRPAGKRIAELYAKKLDKSLGRLGIDCIDAYLMHGIEIPWFFDCVEIWEAYEKAHQAGKVLHFGFSVHKHVREVLTAAAEAVRTGPWRVDLCMVAVNPESYDQLAAELAALKRQDVGIIAMKTTGIKDRPVDGREAKFKALSDGKDYNEWERAKLWMLHMTGGTVDACAAATPDVVKMERNLGLAVAQLSPEARRELQGLVKRDMSGACHLCGKCETRCPEHIAVADMIRCHAYATQYGERLRACESYRRAGYDPASLCRRCGKCEEICPSGVPVRRILVQLASLMA